MPARSLLSRTLEDVRRRVARAGSKGLNEQNTKASLIEPVLRALGWDVEDVEEVVREYRVKTRDKPVDYGLIVLRTPRLFLEAKGLGDNLDDRRWANQIMGYAAVAGVEWIVLTDGNEYRIYNSHAPVSVEEKLFRTVRVSDPASLVKETLELLAKARLEENRIQVLWRAHFVDRQVGAVLEGLFSSDNDLLLVNHVLGRTKNLSAEEVRASLRRCKVHLDFPLTAEAVMASTAAPKSKVLRPRARTDKLRGSDASLKQLIEAGVLRAPLQLTKSYKGRELTAQIEKNGMVTCQGEVHASLSQAGAAARASVIGRSSDGELPPTNGWTFWKFRAPDGRISEIDELRKLFASKETKGVASA